MTSGAAAQAVLTKAGEYLTFQLGAGEYAVGILRIRDITQRL